MSREQALQAALTERWMKTAGLSKQTVVSPRAKAWLRSDIEGHLSMAAIEGASSTAATNRDHPSIY